MSLIKYLGVFCISFGLMSCGNSKKGLDSAPVPHFGEKKKTVSDKETLVLKKEGLKLTHFTQTWKFNSLLQEEGAEKYLLLEKEFLFPIQFNGWVVIDNVEHDYGKCLQAASEEPLFLLEDDHNNVSVMKVGEKIPVSLEKLYVIRVEFPNQGGCKTVGIQFGVLYGTNE